MQVSQSAMVEKDHKEVFSSQGQVMVRVPEVKGDLTICHDGNFASRQFYTLDVSVFFCA